MIKKRIAFALSLFNIISSTTLVAVAFSLIVQNSKNLNHFQWITIFLLLAILIKSFSVSQQVRN